MTATGPESDAPHSRHVLQQHKAALSLPRPQRVHGTSFRSVGRPERAGGSAPVRHGTRVHVREGLAVHACGNVPHQAAWRHHLFQSAQLER